MPLKPRNCADRPARQNIECRSLDFVDVIAIPRVADVIAAFVQRPTSEIEEASKL